MFRFTLALSHCQESASRTFSSGNSQSTLASEVECALHLLDIAQPQFQVSKQTTSIWEWCPSLTGVGLKGICELCLSLTVALVQDVRTQEQQAPANNKSTLASKVELGIGDTMPRKLCVLNH